MLPDVHVESGFLRIALVAASIWALKAPIVGVMSQVVSELLHAWKTLPAAWVLAHEDLSLTVKVCVLEQLCQVIEGLPAFMARTRVLSLSHSVEEVFPVSRQHPGSVLLLCFALHLLLFLL